MITIRLGGSGPNEPLIQIFIYELVKPYMSHDEVTINGEETCSFDVSPGPNMVSRFWKMHL
jgi:hypothetical protein